jgi:LEA14-like dessication related protein
MKKTLFILVPVIILLAVGVFFWKKKEGAQKLDFGVLDTKVKWLGFTEGIEIALKPVIKNFGDSEFSVNQLKVDVYTENNILLTSQDKPISKPILIKPNQNSAFEIKYKVGIDKLILLAVNSGLGKNPNILDIWNKYKNSGKFGFKIRTKGFADVDGVTVDFDEVTEI